MAIEATRGTVVRDDDDFPPMLQGRFPWVLDVSPDELLAIVTKLLSTEDGIRVGSSFVHDANAPVGKRRLWLSDISLERLKGWVTVSDD